MTNKDILELFHQHQLRATPQRLAVYNYLFENRTHPSADDIYAAVAADNPSFSKTTVYNSLKALVDCGLAGEISIDSDRLRYDANTNYHGHFKCKQCGRIYDFVAPQSDLRGLTGFQIHQRNMYLDGLCRSCNK